MSRNLSISPVFTRSTNPKLLVFQPNKVVNTSVEPVFRYYTSGSGQTFYPDPSR